jgi:hypothetical protein
MRWGVLLVGYAVLIAAGFTAWVRGCDEVPDCSGVPLIAYYALLPLVVIWIAVAVVLLVTRIRRRRRYR